MERNEALNVLKGIGCIGVVFIHIPFPGDFGKAIARLAYFAVPVFFLISGWFACSVNDETIIRRGKRIFFIFVYSLALYGGFSIISHYLYGDFGKWVDAFTDLKTWAWFIVLGDCRIVRAGHLWFLPALLYDYCFLFIMRRMNLWGWVKYSLPICFIGMMFVEVYTELMGMSPHLRGNFFIEGMQYFFLGYLLAENKEVLRNINRNLIMSGFLVSFSVVIVCTLGKIPLAYSFVAIVPYSVCLFIHAIKNPQFTHGYRAVEVFRAIGERYSLHVYIMHILVWLILNKIGKVLGIVASTWYDWGSPVIVVAFSVLFGVCFCMLQDKLVKS